LLSSEQLRCDDLCEQQLRNMRFRQALDIREETTLTPPSNPIEPVDLPYPAALLTAVASQPQLLALIPRLEKAIADLLVSDAQVLNLPPMPAASRRWLVRQMAPHYRMRSDVFDYGANRSVRLLRQRDSRRPRMLLSDAVRFFMRFPALARPADEKLLLHLYNLDTHPGISPDELLQQLQAWESRFTLNYLDRSHAILMFSDASARAEVLAKLQRLRNFQFEPDDQSAPTSASYGAQSTNASRGAVASSSSSSSSSSALAGAGASGADAWFGEGELAVKSPLRLPHKAAMPAGEPLDNWDDAFRWRRPVRPDDAAESKAAPRGDAGSTSAASGPAVESGSVARPLAGLDVAATAASPAAKTSTVAFEDEASGDEVDAAVNRFDALRDENGTE
jgi:hypothetical protein